MRRNNKSIYIVLIVVALIGITIGYAVINTTLNINGKSSISKNTWNVYFDNIVVKEDSVEEVKLPTIENSTTVDFEVALNLPGDFYEFTVDVVNNGSIDAMIESIEKTPVLTEEQEKYLNYIIEYENGEQILRKQLVRKEGFVRLKVKVELRKDVDPSDLPEVGDVLYLSFTVNYQQADNTGINVNNNGILNTGVKPVANGSLDAVGTIVTIGDQQFYTIGTEDENVKLLSMYNLYVGNKVDNNWNITALENPTGKQSEVAKGWVDGALELYGTTAFSSSTQHGTNYNGSIVEGYVNAYKEILEGEEYGIDVVEARLITKDELESEDIGCDFSNYTCSDAPSWIYATSYWSGSASDGNNVWGVSSNGDFIRDYYGNALVIGVRPVIIISKSLF